MLRSLADSLNNLTAAVRWASARYPAETIRFASAATMLETPGASPTGWSWQRMFQRRGNVVITDRRILLRSSFLSLYSLFYLLLLAYALYRALTTGDYFYAILGLLIALILVQRLPYTRDIPFEQVEQITLGAVQGISGGASLMAVQQGGRTINIVPAQLLPEEVRAFLQSRQAAPGE